MIINFNKMDKSQIINEIKDILKFKTDKELADFLGVKQNTISTWRSRNTMDYDLMISKCDFLNANWLMTGKGSMFNPESNNIYIQGTKGVANTGYIGGTVITANGATLSDSNQKDAEIEQLLNIIKAKDEIIKSKEEIIKSKEEIIDLLKNK